MSQKSNMTRQGVTRQGLRDLNNIGGPRKPKGKQLEEPPPEAFMTPGERCASGNGFGSHDQDDIERYASDETYENRRESRRGQRN